MNRLRSLLSLRGMLLRYSVGSRAKNLQRARLWSSVYNKLMFALDKNSLKRKNKIDLSKNLICGDFKDLTWFRQNLPFSSSLKKTKEDCLQAGSGWHFLNVHWDFRYQMRWVYTQWNQYRTTWISQLNSLRLCSCSTKLRKWFTQFQHVENKRNVEKILYT